MNENENVTDTVEESDLASESDWKPTSGMYHRHTVHRILT